MIKKLFVKSAVAAVISLGFSGLTLAAAVLSVDAPASTTYGLGNSFVFTVNYDSPVDVTGSPTISFDVDQASGPSATRTAVYVTPAGPPTAVTALQFSYTVQTDDLDTNGVGSPTGLIVLASGATIDDAGTSNNSDLPLPGGVPLSGVNVDGVVPTITSVTPPAPVTYAAGQHLDFIVNFSEPVTINSGVLSLELEIGTLNTHATYLSGSPGTALTLRYTVGPGDEDLNGIIVGAINPGALFAFVQDIAGNHMSTSLGSVNTGSVLVSSPVANTSVRQVPVNSPYLLLLMLAGLGFVARTKLRKC